MMFPPTLYVYPKLDETWDFGFVRLGGAGLGNCFFSYFYSFVFAAEIGARLIHPAWRSVKIGPMLRGERSKRFYNDLFVAPEDEIKGVHKFSVLITSLALGEKRHKRECGYDIVHSGSLAVVRCEHPSFYPLQSWRNEIRIRLLSILSRSFEDAVSWGSGNFIAVHVRLGDFAPADEQLLREGTTSNVRIPMGWYKNVIIKLRVEAPELPIQLFSDGRQEELADLLAVDGVTLRREPNDMADLIALAEARVLVGSESTFSRWAVFLGNMPSIWFDKKNRPERPSGYEVPINYVLDDMTAITRGGIGLT